MSSTSSDDRPTEHEQEVVVRALARLPRETRGPVLVVGVVVASVLILTAGLRVGDALSGQGWRGVVVLGMLGLMIAAIVAIGVVLDRRRSPGS